MHGLRDTIHGRFPVVDGVGVHELLHLFFTIQIYYFMLLDLFLVFLAWSRPKSVWLHKLIRSFHEVEVLLLFINGVSDHHSLVRVLNLVEVIRYRSYELPPSPAVLSDDLGLKHILKWILVDGAFSRGIVPGILDPLSVLLLLHLIK